MRSARDLIVAPAALVGILGLDALLARAPSSVLVLGLLDDTAHLLTSVVLLAALPMRRLLPWALLGSVAIDLDHAPLYTFASGFTVGGRPPTHSLMTVILLLAIAATLLRVRVAATGLALGVLLHFVRDVATGPGVPLFWPVSLMTVRVEYRYYLIILLVAMVIATAAAIRRTGRRQRARRLGETSGTRQ